MWNMGYTGYGLVTFVNDTGVNPSHPAYKLKYRGHYVDPAQAWFQYNSSNTQPFDCSDHGSHTLGTMIGLDRNTDDTIGVAFNALWMGSPILCGIGTEDNVAAFQWALDPDGNPNTIDDMPDVINNSWHDSSLDSMDCVSIYVSILDALEASGIAVVFSAGNDGPGPETISEPHNINTDLVNTFTVAALNGNNSNLLIADFSSRGPSHCSGTGSFLIKPEVAAPGVSVRSSILNGEYGTKSGTSMAAPHVAGAILLLKEAFPELTGTELKLALYNTCTDLGEAGEDNTYGMGIIDVFEAYNYLIQLGNVPVIPSVTHDVMIYDAEAPTYICYGEISASIKIENAGTETLTSFDVFYEISGPTSNSGVLNWTGDLTVGGRMTLEIPQLTIGAGVHELFIEISQPNGQTDDRELNNAYRQTLISIEEIPFYAEVEQIDDNAACQGASALIRANYEGNGTVEWYDEPTEGNLLGTGNELLTSPLNSSETYYADARIHAKTGIANPDPEHLDYSADIENGLIFDSYFPFILKSFTIYPNSTGVLIVNISRKSGLGIGSKMIVFTEVVEKVVEWDVMVPQGEDFVLSISSGVSVLHSIEGINYPYTIDAVMSIKKLHR